MKPRLLDGFCGGGGAAVGYHRAGFEVVGVDSVSQKNYPFEFVQADFFEYVAEHWHEYDVIHASPVCKGYSVANNIHSCKTHPLDIPTARQALVGTGRPYIIENVEGARKDLLSPVVVCGRALGLGVKRHRLFESNLLLSGTICPKGHPGDWLSVFGHTVLSRGKGGGGRIKRKHAGVERGREAMGIPWMNRQELSDAVPPAYTAFLGRQLMWHLEAAA